MAKPKKEHYQIYIRQIEALSKIANLITSGLYLGELLRLVVNVTAEIMNSKISSLMLLDPEKKELMIKATQSVSRTRSGPASAMGGTFFTSILTLA